MASSAKQIIGGSVLTGSAVTYYTAPSPVVIKKLSFCNTTAGTVNVSLYLVPSGGSVGASSTLEIAHQIIANETWSCPDVENMVLETGSTIRALGSGVTIMGSGVLI